ncbi:hypothetical protein NKJ60_30810, partial [Mesorhizobium sp. M0085]
HNARPRDAMDKETCVPRSRGRSLVVLYNAERPHEAIDGAVPLDRYRSSPRDFRETQQPFDYAPGDHIRKIQQKGATSLFGRHFKICNAFAGRAVAFRATDKDGVFNAFSRHQKIQTIDLNLVER